jgi:uncharacterized protein YigA (DUF484 family)
MRKENFNFLHLLHAPYQGLEQENEQSFQRWRRAILQLSQTLSEAAEQRRDLEPFLAEAFDHALWKLLFYGSERDLMALERWLEHENEDRHRSFPPE